MESESLTGVLLWGRGRNLRGASVLGNRKGGGGGHD
jgi:hypothetical protein